MSAYLGLVFVFAAVLFAQRQIPAYWANRDYTVHAENQS